MLRITTSDQRPMALVLLALALLSSHVAIAASDGGRRSLLQATTCTGGKYLKDGVCVNCDLGYDSLCKPGFLARQLVVPGNPLTPSWADVCKVATVNSYYGVPKTAAWSLCAQCKDQYYLEPIGGSCSRLGVCKICNLGYNSLCAEPIRDSCTNDDQHIYECARCKAGFWLSPTVPRICTICNRGYNGNCAAGQLSDDLVGTTVNGPNGPFTVTTLHTCGLLNGVQYNLCATCKVAGKMQVVDPATGFGICKY